MNPTERIKQQSEFKRELEQMTKEQLQEKYDEYLKLSEEKNEEVSKKEFTLPKSSKGAPKQEEAFEAVKYFLDKQKVRWNYALAMISIYEFFDKKQTKIPFTMLDTVLRMFGELEFESYKEWKKVNEINTYFQPIADEYRTLTDEIYLLAEEFQMVDNQLKLFETQSKHEDRGA